jgi:hypothetical protein
LNLPAPLKRRDAAEQEVRNPIACNLAREGKVAALLIPRIAVKDNRRVFPLTFKV